MYSLALASNPQSRPQYLVTEPDRARRLRLASSPGIPKRLRAICNTIAYHADAAGLFSWSVAALTWHRHLIGHRRLSERTVQYQLRELELCGVLVVVTPAGGRGHVRSYRVQLERFSALDARRYHPLRDAGWVKGRKPEKGATKGCNNGSKKGATTASYPFNSFVLTRTNRERRAAEKGPGRSPTAAGPPDYLAGCPHQTPCKSSNQCYWLRQIDASPEFERLRGMYAR